MNKIKNTFKKNVLLSSLVIIAVIVVAVMFFGRSSDVVETITMSRSTLKQQVSASGKVVAQLSSELGFEQGGRISRVITPVGTMVSKGSLIASIENGDAQAEVLQKRAALSKEESRLISLENGTRPEQLAIDEQTYTDSRNTLIVKLRSTALDIEDALLSDIDTMFDDGSSVNPKIQIISKGYQEEQKINNQRFAVTENLEALKNINEMITSTSEDSVIDSALSKARELFTAMSTLSNTLISITNDLYPNNSGYTQTQIDTYKTSANTGSQTLAETMNTLQTAETKWKQSRNSLALSKAGSTNEDLDIQRAAIQVAEADLISAEAHLAKTLIIAPFDGVVTRMDLKQGEIVSPNTSKVSIMSTSSFKIESYIPEVNIAHIKVGDPAKVTLDAYGTDIVFNANVTFIDPAETIRDGVSTYKVTLAFTEQDARIRSGMTANVTITTLEKPNVFILPKSIITTNDSGIMTIKKLVGDEYLDVVIKTGDTTTLGQVEVIDGVSEGDVIRVDGQTK